MADQRKGMDDISLAIGELKADARAGTAQRVELFKQVGDIKDDISEIKQILKESNSTVMAMLAKHNDQYIEVDKDIKGLKSFRTKIYVGIAGVGGLGGLTGAVMTKLGIK